MSVKILIDSTADIPSGEKEQFSVVPLTIHFGDEEFIDGITIDHKRFYEKLIESDVMPTTSQVPPQKFAEAFQNAVADGSEAVVITISSNLSGTYQSACIAAADFEGKVFVVDSKSATIGTGILAQLAMKLKNEGKAAEEIAATLEKERDNVRLVAMLDTLEYLKRGGRISKTVAFAGGLLSIKPVIAIEDGEIKILGKARGSKQGNNLLVTEIANCGGVDFSKPHLLGYTGLNDELLQKYIADSSELWQDEVDNLPQTVVGSVVGTHAGPGAVAVAFFKNS